MLYRISVTVCMTLALALWWMAKPVWTNEAPAIPENLSYVFSSECEDKETGTKGTCHVFTDPEGWYYTAFWLHEELMFIRRSKGDTPYETVWERDDYRGI